MKIAVANTRVPFVRGGAEKLSDELIGELHARGHEVQELKIPFRWATSLAVQESMLAAAALQIPEADLLIALKFPAYLIPHPNKVLWVAHQFRQMYDLWDTPFRGYPDGEAEELRSAVRTADERAFREAKAIYGVSSVPVDRMRRYNNVRADVLTTPMDGDSYFTTGRQDYIYVGGRINESKRQLLLVQALALCAEPVRMVVAGQPESADLERLIAEQIQSLGLSDRVRFEPRFVTEEEKRDRIASALAAAYIPIDEDSYGYVSAEAMFSHKPVITTSDSGGVADVIEDGKTGLVVEPTAVALAEAMDRLWRSAGAAAVMGEAASSAIRDMDLSWDRVIGTLLS